jgi:hypothetical protein
MLSGPQWLLQRDDLMLRCTVWAAAAMGAAAQAARRNEASSHRTPPTTGRGDATSPVWASLWLLRKRLGNDKVALRVVAFAGGAIGADGAAHGWAELTEAGIEMDWPAVIELLSNHPTWALQ